MTKNAHHRRTRPTLIITIIALVAFVVTCLYVPTRLYAPPPEHLRPSKWMWITEIGEANAAASGWSYTIDFDRLLLLWLAIAALLAIARLTCDALLLTGEEPDRGDG